MSYRDTPQLEPGRLGRVVLISVNQTRNYSLGLPLIKAYADNHPRLAGKIDISIWEQHLARWRQRNSFALLRRLVMASPHLVAFSCNIWNAATVAAVIPWLRRMMPKTLIILGGQDICEPFDEIEAIYPDADVMIKGEGEAVFADLLIQLMEWGTEGLPKTMGIRYRDGAGKWHSNPPSPVIEDLDTIPSAYLSGLALVPRNAWIGAMIESTRGCPFKCGYCHEALRYYGQRRFSIERTASEISLLLDRGVKRFHILNPTLHANKCTENLGQLLKNLDLDGVEISAEIYAESITPLNIKRLDFVTHCEVGLQTISDQAAEAINRPWQRERFERGFSLLREAGKVINLDMIVGLPGETLDSFIEGLEYVDRLAPDNVVYNHLLMLRGTPLRLEASKHGISFNASPPYKVLETAQMSAADLKKALALGKHVMENDNKTHTMPQTW